MEGLQKSIVMWRNRRSTSSDQYRTMTVQFDFSSTPGYGSYLDDAGTMPFGKSDEAISAWQEFFGYKPCLFKNGQVVGYLDPNDFTKMEDGSTVSVSATDGIDTMIEFPRRGIKISKYNTYATVSMTDNPNAEGFTYYAHTRGNSKKDNFYVGAYLAGSYYGMMTSVKDTLVSMFTSSDARTRASNRGSTSGYNPLAFYQFLYIQCMYVLQFRGYLDSQTAVGLGYMGSIKANNISLGSTYNKGLIYGSASSNEHVKLFGIEDMWFYGPCFVDGYYTKNNNDGIHILTTTDNFNDTGSRYTDTGVANSVTLGQGTMGNATCTSENGFTPTDFYRGTKFSGGFCDGIDLYDKRLLLISSLGNYDESGYTGIFQMSVTGKTANTYYQRLMYL